METFEVEVSGLIVDDVEMTPVKHDFRYVAEGRS